MRVCAVCEGRGGVHVGNGGWRRPRRSTWREVVWGVLRAFVDAGGCGLLGMGVGVVMMVVVGGGHIGV